MPDIPDYRTEAELAALRDLVCVPAYRTSIVAVHDEQGSCDLICVVYRVERTDRSRLAWEASIMLGSPPEQFREAYRHMIDRCAQLNLVKL